MISFLLDEEVCTLQHTDPNTSVLDYLRDTLNKTGSKEGCASGDCGACTVVVGELASEPTAEGVRYRAINACITPVATLHNKQLITVENLKNGDNLHPVQQAMVDCHGSQCGFCTPGFVMSMFAYRKTNERPDRASINEALGGNLCRCTGYRPIIEAAVKMYEVEDEDQFTNALPRITEMLSQLQRQGGPVKLEAAGRSCYSPTTVEELADLLMQYPEARLLAGGTDLCLELTQFLRDIDVLIYTGRVQQMKTLTLTPEALEIGAAVTYTDANSELVAMYPDLHELIERLGSRQIRNQGTIGGNIGNASPIGDMPPVLIALGATLKLRCGTQYREMAVEDYFVSYKVTAQRRGEFIESVSIPRPRPNQKFKAYKVTKRLEDDISATCGAFSIELDGDTVVSANIAFGGMAEIPRRAPLCEQALINQPWTETTIEAAMTALANDFNPISDFRSSAAYRLEVSQNFLRRFYHELNACAAAVRVTHYA